MNITALKKDSKIYYCNKVTRKFNDKIKVRQKGNHACSKMINDNEAIHIG